MLTKVKNSEVRSENEVFRIRDKNITLFLHHAKDEKGCRCVQLIELFVEDYKPMIHSGTIPLEKAVYS